MATQSSYPNSPVKKGANNRSSLGTTCSVAVNTSLWQQQQPPMHDASQDVSHDGSSPFRATVSDNMGLSDTQVAQLQGVQETSITSNIVVDMPEYQSLSPDK